MSSSELASPKDRSSANREKLNIFKIQGDKWNKDNTVYTQLMVEAETREDWNENGDREPLEKICISKRSIETKL